MLADRLNMYNGSVCSTLCSTVTWDYDRDREIRCSYGETALLWLPYITISYSIQNYTTIYIIECILQLELSLQLYYFVLYVGVNMRSNNSRSHINTAFLLRPENSIYKYRS